MSEHELLVPFVACLSQGGPYDDLAFAAGFEAGKLWADLEMALGNAVVPQVAEHVGRLVMAAAHYLEETADVR